MSSEKLWPRFILGISTTLVVLLVILFQGGRIDDDWQYVMVVGVLTIFVLLAVQDSGADVLPRSLTSFISRYLGDGLFGVREAFEEGVHTLQGLPWQVYGSIAPSLERVTSAFRGDGGSKEVVNTDLTSKLYEGEEDASLHVLGQPGKVDKDKFSAMKLEYKRVAVLLCRMRLLVPAAHDALILAMSGCPLGFSPPPSLPATSAAPSPASSSSASVSRTHATPGTENTSDES